MQQENPIAPEPIQPQPVVPPAQPPAPAQPAAGTTIPAAQVNSWLDQRPAGSSVIEPPKSNLLKKLLIGGAIVAIIAVGISAYFVVRPTNGEGLTVEIGLPDQLQAGVPTELAVQISNNSGSSVTDAQVTVELPDEIVFIGSPSQATFQNKKVGTIENGTMHKESFMVMATGQENTLGQVTSTISYVPGALSSRFEKSATKSVVLAPGGFTVSVSAPTKVLSSQQFTTTLTYSNNTNLDYEDVKLIMDYPDGFTLQNASSSATAQTANGFELGTIKSGSTGTVILTGFLVGQDNSTYPMSGTISALIGEVRYDVAHTSANVTLAQSPLSIRTELEGGNSQIIAPGSALHYRLTYTNNTQVGMRDVIVTAKTIGEMFDLKTLKTNGSLRPSDNSIVWNAARVPDLSSLAAGATGVVTFEIATKAAYPITKLSSKNFTVTVKSQIESPTVPPGVSTDKTVGLSQLTSKMRGALGFVSAGYYRDAASGIVNGGSLPAGVGRTTQFTIHWTFKNTSTDVASTTLKASLGPNVRYAGVYKSTTGVAPVYNERTQEFTWGVASISATQGILSKPVELIFQVELAPAADQIGDYPQLVGPVTGSYTDLYTGEQLPISDGAVALQLPDDASVANIDRRVKAN